MLGSRRVYLIYLLIASLVLTSCAEPSQDTEGRLMPYDLNNIQLIGEDKDTIFRELNLTEADASDHFNSDGIYGLPDVEFIDYTFDQYLIFDISNEELYGFWYVIEFEGQAEEAVELIEDLLDEIVNTYGEADTYPNHPHSLIAEDDLLAEIRSDGVFRAFETWYLDDIDDLALRLGVSTPGQDFVSVSVQYELDPLASQEFVSP